MNLHPHAVGRGRWGEWDGSERAVALAEKFSQATAPKIMLFGVRDASDRCHPAFSAPFVRTLTDILRCLTKCSIRWFDQAKHFNRHLAMSDKVLDQMV